jgi:phosphoribosyl-ATP pyrophosphohydrolase/phosphoribosyl-AMP cyclohydrolase/histidinol dehydrogenase
MIEIVELTDLLARRDALDPATSATAEHIVEAVRRDGEAALRRYAEQFDGLTTAAPLLLDRAALRAGWQRLSTTEQGVLERTAARIRDFALEQRRQLSDFQTTSGGYRCGHACAPVERAGCYAPGGRHPLPSSVLMTVVTARVAGVEVVVVASPWPVDVTLGAAFIAGADALLPVGGAQAIAALAFGVGGCPACDVVVGPGNRFVTAAKQFVSRHVGIDMLAGPTELVVAADAGADPERIAADLLAQAEHDVDARPILITSAAPLAPLVQAAVARQLVDLPTAETAAAGLRAGGIVVCDSAAAMAAACDALAPEHLALHLDDAAAFAGRLSHYGAIFVGSGAAEVLGDYGVGPNHVLPTGGVARRRGGLSVFDFLRVRTFIDAGPTHEVDEAEQRALVLQDVVALAEMEGLVGHARSARLRATR